MRAERGGQGRGMVGSEIGRTAAGSARAGLTTASDITYIRECLQPCRRTGTSGHDRPRVHKPRCHDARKIGSRGDARSAARCRGARVSRARRRARVARRGRRQRRCHARRRLLAFPRQGRSLRRRCASACSCRWKRCSRPPARSARRIRSGALRALAVNGLTRLATDTRTQAVFDVIFHKCEFAAEFASVAGRRTRPTPAASPTSSAC